MKKSLDTKQNKRIENLENLILMSRSYDAGEDGWKIRCKPDPSQGKRAKRC